MLYSCNFRIKLGYTMINDDITDFIIFFLLKVRISMIELNIFLLIDKINMNLIIFNRILSINNYCQKKKIN